MLLFVAAARQRVQALSALALIATLAKGGYKYPLAYLSCSDQGCTKSTIPVIISSLRHAINLARIEKLRDRRSSLKEETTYLSCRFRCTIVVGELNGSVLQRKIVQVESRGNQFTMPRRRRFKPRKDCVAILGKLSSFPHVLFRHLYLHSLYPLSALCFFSLLR